MLSFTTLSIWMSIWTVGNADQSTCPLDSYFDGTYCISCNGLECGPGLEPVTYSNGTCACQACKPGSYSEYYGGQPCRKCSECQEGMFKVLDCWVDRGTLCSLCPRGYFLVTPTFDCKKCSCCCNGFAPQPECLEQGLPSSQACVRDLACECNDTIVVTAPTHTYHQPNATIRVTWPQDTPAAATDAHLTAVFILGSLVGILIIIIVLGICYTYKLKRRRRDFQAMLETPVQEIGPSEYLHLPTTVYSEPGSDTEVSAAQEIQATKPLLHSYSPDICCDKEHTPLMSVENEMTTMASSPLPLDICCDKECTPLMSVETLESEMITMASSPLPLDSSHEKEKYPLVSSLPENNQLTDRGGYKALPVAAQTKKIRWLDSSRLESLKKRLQQDNDLEKVLSYFRSTLPMPIDCGGGFDPWSFLSVRGKTLEDLHNGLLDLDLVNAARMLRAAVEDQLRSLESNSGSTDVTFPKVVEDGQKALWMQSANPSSVESYPFPVDTGAVSPSQVPSSYKECDTPLHEDPHTHSKSQDLSQGIVFGDSLGSMHSQHDYDKVHGKLIGDQPKMGNVANSLLDTTSLLAPGDVPCQTSDTRQSVVESPQDFGVQEASVGAQPEAGSSVNSLLGPGDVPCQTSDTRQSVEESPQVFEEPGASVGEQPEAGSNVDSLLGPGDVPSQTSNARQSVEESPQVFEEPEASVGEQPEACSSVDSLLGPDAVPRQTLEDRGCVISRECDSYLIAAVGVGGFGLMANGALMIHVFNDTPDDQIELIRRRVKVGFKFSGDVFIEKIQDEIAIREQVLPVNAYSSAVSGGHSDIVEGTLPIREQEGMGPGGRIYTNNSRMEALETILDSSDEFAGLGINDKYLYVLVDDKGVAPEDFNTKCQMIRQKAKRFLDERVKVTKMSFLSILNLDWYFSREADGVDGISKINGEGTYVLEFKRTDDMDENRTKSIEVDRILHEELEYTDDFKWERNEGDQSMSRVSFFFTLADDPKTVYAATVFHVLHPYTFSLYGNPTINRNWLSYRDDLSKLSRKPIDKERQFFNEDGRLFGTAYAGLYSNAGADSGNDLLVIRVDDEYPHMSLKSVIDRDQSVKNHDGKEKEFDVFSGTGKDLMDYNRGFVMLRGSSPSLNGSACESQNVFLKYVSVSRDKKEVSSPMFLVSFNPESQPGDSGATICWADKYHSDVFLVSMHVRKETIGGKAYSGSYRIDEAIAAIEKDIFPNKKVVHYLVDTPSKCSLNSQSRDDSGAENVLNTPSNSMLNSQYNSESAVGSESFTPLDSPLTSPDADDSGVGNVSSTSFNGLLDSQPDNQSAVGSVLSTPLDSPLTSPDADDSGVGNVSSTSSNGLLDSQPDNQSAVGSVLSTPLDSPLTSPDADDSGVGNVSSTPLDGLLDSQPDNQSVVGRVLSTPLDSPVNSPDADDSGVENCI